MAEGSIATEGEQQVKEVIQTVDRITSIEDADQRAEEEKKFVDARLTLLESSSTPKEITVFSGYHKGFIHPESVIRGALYLAGFKLNDRGVYMQLMEDITELRNSPSWKDKPLNALTTSVIQWEVAKYFGNLLGSREVEAQNEEFFLEDMSQPEKVFDLEELKGKEIAVCMQKAALAQNLLAFIDVSSELILAPDTVIDGEKAMHAYNLIHSRSGKDIVYDPTNPSFVLDLEGNIVNTVPSTYVITPEQASGILEGQGVKVEHKTYNINSEIVETDERIYGGAATLPGIKAV